jgi:hypothetical protein
VPRDPVGRNPPPSLGAALSAKRPFADLLKSAALPDPAHVQRIVEAYRKLGFWTALDDFGAGYAGLGLLSRLQPDLIKIDMDSLRDIHLSVAKQAIVAGIVGIARALDITVLAEGVENDQELCPSGRWHFAVSRVLIAKPALMALPSVAGLDPRVMQADCT